MTKPDTALELVRSWQKSKSLISLQMMMSAFKPIIDLEIDRIANLSVRRDDLLKEAERIISGAATSWTPEVGSVQDWFEKQLKELSSFAERRAEFVDIALRRQSK